jgi:hypothetical protein
MKLSVKNKMKILWFSLVSIVLLLTNLPYQSHASGLYRVGDGTPESPYLLENVNDLENVRYCLSCSYDLVNDLDLTGIDWNPIGWYEYGTSSTQFIGTFNGNGRTISNLSINRPMETYIGLFGYVGGGAVIRNLNLKDPKIVGDRWVGSVIGYSGNSSLSNIRVSNPKVTGNVEVGGIAGRSVANTLVSELSVEQSINGDAYIQGVNQVGGIIGKAMKISVTELMNNNVNVIGKTSVGGLIGEFGRIEKSEEINTLSNAWSNGEVIGDSNVGGLVGSVLVDSARTTINIIKNSYTTTNQVYAGIENAGSLVGFSDKLDINSSFALDIGLPFVNGTSNQVSISGLRNQTELKTVLTYYGWDRDIWDIQENQYPIAKFTLTPIDQPSNPGGSEEPANPVDSSNIDITSNFLGGNLEISALQNQIKFDSLNLNGQQQKSYGNMPTVRIVDGRGNNSGWRVMINSTPFIEKAPVGGWIDESKKITLPNNALRLNSPTISSDQSSINGLEVNQDIGIIDNGAKTVSLANQGYGGGHFDLVFPPKSLVYDFLMDVKYIDTINYPDQNMVYETIITLSFISE